MYFPEMSCLIEGSRKNREKINYSLMDASNFPSQALQYNQYEMSKIKKNTLENTSMKENKLATPVIPKAKEN